MSHLAILNREEAEQVARDHFTPQLALLRDLADYGSNLVVRAFNSSPKAMADIVVCGVLLKQIVAMVDATEVLFAAGAGHAAFLPARAAFEASIYLDWILAANSERRATCYVVGNFRDERLWVAKVTPGTAEHAGYDQIMKSIGFDMQAQGPVLPTDAAAHLAEVNRILAQPALQAIDQEFSKLRGKRKRDVEWYQLDGMASIRQVSEAVGRLAQYEVFYSKGSQITHTGSYKHQIRFKSKEVRLLPVRHLASTYDLLACIVTAAFAAYRGVLGRYRPDELSAFSRKYTKDWRAPFQNAKTLKYDF